jgi:hypothetical protein
MIRSDEPLVVYETALTIERDKLVNPAAEIARVVAALERSDSE